MDRVDAKINKIITQEQDGQDRLRRQDKQDKTQEQDGQDRLRRQDKQDNNTGTGWSGSTSSTR